MDGVAARKLEKNGLCTIDVWLVPEDINQQIGIFGNVNGDQSCEANIRVARLILNSLPG